MALDLFITFLLLFLNGFFVAAEFAIVKVRAAQVDLKASTGSRVGSVAKHIVDHLDAYLSANQLGITMTSLALGWFGEEVFSEIIIHLFSFFGLNLDPASAHRAAFPAAFGLLTVLHIVLGELAPKTIAIRYPLRTTMAISLPLRLFYLIFAPLIWLLNNMANLLLRMIGIKPTIGHEIHTEEELRLILTESEEGGAIKQSEHELIQNVFEFDDRVVRQILVPRTKISAIDIDATNDEILNLVIDEQFSRFPVYKDNLDNIIGIIHTRDLLKLLRNNNFSGITAIIRPAYFVPLTKRINELLRELQTQHIQMAIITNEFGGTAGIVTMEDIIEELIGEIQDEYDEEKPSVEKKNEQEFVVNAQTSIGDVNDLLPIALPEGPEYDTISGLMNYIFGRIPAVNEKRIFGGYEFTILKRFKHSVETVHMKVVEETREETED
ncbi:MAG: HlyC/CorC family transporter [Bacteroidetes bacterium]|nr:HlyC/CorC family transporter [Bacteroidota bacterium]